MPVCKFAVGLVVRGAYRGFCMGTFKILRFWQTLNLEYREHLTYRTSFPNSQHFYEGSGQFFSFVWVLPHFSPSRLDNWSRVVTSNMRTKDRSLASSVILRCLGTALSVVRLAAGSCISYLYIRVFFFLNYYFDLFYLLLGD